MAKAPKSSTRKTSSRPKAGKKAEEKVEDAVVIEETLPKEPTPAPESETVKPEAEKQAPASETDLGPDEQRTSEAVGKRDSAPNDRPSAPEGDGPKADPSMTPMTASSGRGVTGGFVGLLLGGVAAAAIGFVAARYVVPEGWPLPGVTPEPNPLALAIEAQAEEIANLSASVSALEADTGLADLAAALDTELSALREATDAAAARLDAVETRLAAVERLAPEGSAAAQMAAEAYERELAALRQMFEGELAKVEAAQTDASALEAQAADAERAAVGRAALARITSALDAGHPFGEALTELTAATGIEPPPGLAGYAEEGVPTLTALQTAFPAAARAALDAATRAQVESGEVSRFAAFLQTQLGTRSLEPREGDDADAVLSRAEAALKQGDIAGAITEIDALPDAGKPAMADWRAVAEIRKAALEAGAALSDALNAK